VQGDDILSVFPGTLEENDLAAKLANADGAVIMKLGRNLPKVRRAIAAAGRLDSAVYVERGTMPNGVSMRLADKADDVAPYFALILVPGWSTRP
jgi:precorrin-2/cobalt-factor-2 C20-methyltransferase